jgi:hypothetical protein
VVPPDKKNQLPALVRDFTSQLTVRDVVLRDDLIEVMGSKFDLQPILAGDTSEGGRAGTPKERFFKVALVKDQGKWLVDSYDSFMVEKK